MVSTQISNVNIELVYFLRANEQEMLDIWQEQIIVHKEEDSVELIRGNGQIMLQIVINSLMSKLSENELKGLAYKVAKERNDTNINIGEFVYNVNLGRSIIIKYVNQSGIEIEKLQPIIDLINQQFDLFCYYAVSKYTELKDKKIQEKNLFITRSHKNRLEILGQMSSSFVHEFRNPLTSIMGFISLLKKDHPSLPYLDIISSELEQLNFRITQFLHTSKIKQVTESNKEVISINLLLGEIIEFLYPSFTDGCIHINTDIDEDAMVYGDRDELKQVFLNILMNAIDAVNEEVGTRKINIEVKLDNDQVIIIISNNGQTIKKEDATIIFEPFFTTKKLGTGIGLFVCKNIIEKNNGTIQCISQDELTTFEIKLPSYQI
ncbi:MAG: GHKL domain-containing protein [Lysinibacillus sp.]|nr:GHKL domain-containing protein [Lysinibacillus sp.]